MGLESKNITIKQKQNKFEEIESRAGVHGKIHGPQRKSNLELTKLRANHIRYKHRLGQREQGPPSHYWQEQKGIKELTNRRPNQC